MAISEMDKVVQAINGSTAEHHARLRKLKLRMATLIVRSESSAWHDLCREVDAVLEPTLKLIGEIAARRNPCVTTATTCSGSPRRKPTR